MGLKRPFTMRIDEDLLARIDASGAPSRTAFIEEAIRMRLGREALASRGQGQRKLALPARAAKGMTAFPPRGYRRRAG